MTHEIDLPEAVDCLCSAGGDDPDYWQKYAVKVVDATGDNRIAVLYVESLLCYRIVFGGGVVFFRESILPFLAKDKMLYSDLVNRVICEYIPLANKWVGDLNEVLGIDRDAYGVLPCRTVIIYILYRITQMHPGYLKEHQNTLSYANYRLRHAQEELYEKFNSI